MYFIQKEGVYFHGIFWVGDDLEVASTKVKLFAEGDMDDYHCWVIYKFVEQSYKDDPENDPIHEEIFSIRKGVG